MWSASAVNVSYIGYFLIQLLLFNCARTKLLIYHRYENTYQLRKIMLENKDQSQV